MTSPINCAKLRFDGILPVEFRSILRTLPRFSENQIEFEKAVHAINRTDVKNTYTRKYSYVHAIYWSICCSSSNFASVFLLSKNFSNRQIGYILALANIFAAFLQPAIADIADKSRKITLKDLTLLLTIAAGLFATARFFTVGSSVAIAVLFVLELTLLLVLQPLVTSLGMKLINDGIAVNFSLARGIGSMTFAVLSIILGSLIGCFGTGLLPAISAVLYALQILAVNTFAEKRFVPATGNPSGTHRFVPAAHPKNGSTNNLFVFMAQNKRFTMLVAAIILTFCSHSMINNYFIQITKSVGGKTAEMGIAIGIAAAIELPAMVLFNIFLKRISCSAILKFSLFFFLVKATVTLYAPNIWMLYTAQLLEFFSYALFIPASIYYVNRIIKAEDRTKGQAFMTSASTIGSVVASFLGGWLLDYRSVKIMLLVGTLFAALGFLIALGAVEKKKEHDFLTAS